MSRRPTGGRLTKLEMKVLTTLVDGSKHGYHVGQILYPDKSPKDAASGGASQILRRLEAIGAVESDLTIVGGRSRRIYKLTQRGERLLAGIERL